MRNEGDQRRALEELLDSAIQEKVWSAIVGSTGDYVLSLQLGTRERRSARLANPRLSFLQRTYEGSVGFLIECPWRFDGPDGVLFSYLSLIEDDGSQKAGDLPPFLGLTLESFEIESSPWDMALVFSNGYKLHCFCAEVAVAAPTTIGAQSISSRETRQKPLRNARNNWSFWCPKGSIVIGPSGEITQNEDPPGDGTPRRLREIMDVDDPPTE